MWTTHAESRRRTLSAGVALTVLGMCLAGLGLLTGGSAWATAASGSDCLASSSGIQTHFLVSSGTAGAMPQISGLVLSGFDQASCDGLPVQDILSGNDAGNPAPDPDRLLSTLDSAKDPCTGADASSPVTITNGSITLVGCPTETDPHRAAYASIHDITRQQIKVDGVDIVSGPPTTEPPTTDPEGTVPEGSGPEGTGNSAGTGTGTTQVSPPKGTVHTQVSPPHQSSTNTSTSTGPESQQSTQTGVLAQTGGPSSILLLLGIVFVVFGVVFLLLGRRRTAEEQ